MAKRVRRKRTPTREIDLETISRLNLPKHILKHTEIIAQKAQEGFNQNEIANFISKSPAYVSHCYTLSNLPKSIQAAVNAGLANLPLITMLNKLYEQNPKYVEKWLKDFSNPPITTYDIDRLSYDLNHRQNAIQRQQNENCAIVKYRRKFAVIVFKHENPPPRDHVWIRFINIQDNVTAAPISQLRLIAVH